MLEVRFSVTLSEDITDVEYDAVVRDFRAYFHEKGFRIEDIQRRRGSTIIHFSLTTEIIIASAALGLFALEKFFGKIIEEFAGRLVDKFFPKKKAAEVGTSFERRAWFLVSEGEEVLREAVITDERDLEPNVIASRLGLTGLRYDLSVRTPLDRIDACLLTTEPIRGSFRFQLDWVRQGQPAIETPVKEQNSDKGDTELP